MKRLFGIILLIVGLVATFLTGLDAYQNTESFKVFGERITLSQADWTPVIISGVVALAGLLLVVSGGGKSKSRSRR